MAALALLTVLASGLSCRTLASAPGDAASRPDHTLILLSFDGWRWDYQTKVATPNLDRLIAGGVRAERLIPAFPTKTFPNHYSIVTGLYPAHHGMVGNRMSDLASGLTFTTSDRQAVTDARWWGGEPLWVTAERQGVLSATLFWPGSEAPIGGTRPRYWLPYDERVPNDTRVDDILAWLDLPLAERPRLLLGYFSDVDMAGHRSGPESREVLEAIVSLDRVLGRLMDGLATRGLLETVNVAVVSDHGMAETSPDRWISLDDYLPPEAVDVVEAGPYVALNPRAMTTAQVYERLHGAHPHLRVFLREETPLAWHYRDHPRIPAIVGVADEGWEIVKSHSTAPPRASKIGGNHGYDPAVQSMHALFVAAGPAFRKGVTVPPFENVHLYNALAAALGIRPSPNDGDPELDQR